MATRRKAPEFLGGNLAANRSDGTHHHREQPLSYHGHAQRTEFISPCDRIARDWLLSPEGDAMATDITPTLRRVLRELQALRSRIDQQIAIMQRVV